MKTKNQNYPYYNNPKIEDLKELLELRKTSKDSAFSFRDGDKVVTKSFAQVYRDVQNLSRFLLGKYKNRHIALIGENSYPWLITFFAIILSGNIAVILDKDLDEKEISNRLKQTDTKDVFYSKSYCPYIDKLKINALALDNMKEYLSKGKASDKELPKVDREKDAAIFFTSGTTSKCKAVVLSQKNLAADIYGASALFRPEGKVIAFLPFHHAFGLMTSAIKPFYYGHENFISSSFKNLLDDFKTAEPGTTFAVPLVIETFYKQIWKSVRQKGKERQLKTFLRVSNGLLKLNLDVRDRLFKTIRQEFGGNLHYIICGGAYLDVKYVKFFRALGIEILNGYGITECSPVIAVNRNEFKADGSVGQPCRGIDVKVKDGEILVRGDIVMKNYYKDRRATAESIQDGFFHTGDLGFIDENGFIFVTGRKKNLIILSNGENISPEVIEQELLKDKSVSEIVVYEYGNKIVAAIFPTDEFFGDQEYFDDLIYNYNKGRPKNHQIAMVELRNSPFPRNSNGKILKHVLLDDKTVRKG